MVYARSPNTIRFGGFDGPPPRDVIAILLVIFATFSLQFFDGVAGLLEWLRLTPLVWRGPLVFQVATYPWIGVGGPSPWILLELWILYMFASDMFRELGRRRFWELILVASISAGVVATVVDLVAALLGAASANAFVLMQGQRMLLLVVIAAFATRRAHATILLFFVLPIQAKWFLWLEIALGFIGFLGTKDLPGFLGICVAVGISNGLLRPGGFGRMLREPNLRLQQWWIERRLARMRRKSRLRIVSDQDPNRDRDPKDPPWVH